MKTLLLSAALSFAVFPAFSQQAPAAYSDADAANHVGEEATVTGKVASVSSSGKGNTFMNFGERFPRHTFSAVVFASKADAVGDVKQYEGKQVSVTGRIDLGPDKKPQIIVNRADQLKLAVSATPSSTPSPEPPPPPAPAATTAGTPAAPSASPSMTPPAPGPVATPSPATEPVERKTAGKVSVGAHWNAASQTGEMTRKDLAKIFGTAGMSSEELIIPINVEVYPGVPVLTPLAQAKKTLTLENASAVKTRIDTPGIPQDSFVAYTFSGIFPGGYSKLSLIVDNTEQVVSVLLVDPNARSSVPNEPDTDGYHTYNFVSGRAKAKNDLVIRHKLVPDAAPAGIVVVDTLLIDPFDGDQPNNRSGGGKSSSKSTSKSKPKNGKVMERSRWFVPTSVVNLILRCVTR